MKTKYKKEELEKFVKESSNWREVCEKIGITSKGGNQTHIKNVSNYYNISYSHFCGSNGKKSKPAATRTDASLYFYKNSNITSHELKCKLIRDGYKKYECEMCSTYEWMGEPVVLELDHINSDHTDNRLENLQILCPNCHRLKTRKMKKTKSINKKPNPKLTCPDCGNNKSRQSLKCKYCVKRISPNKVEVDLDKLREMVFKKPFTQLRFDFGVSDSVLIRLCKKHNIPTPERGHWSRNNF